MVDAVERLQPLDGELLDTVDVLLALVVSLPCVALRILVVQHASAGLHHGAGRVVFAWDEAQLIVLALLLLDDAFGDFRIDFFQGWVGHFFSKFSFAALSTNATSVLFGGA